MTIKEAYDVIFNGKDSSYSVGVEIFKDGDFWGSCLANDIFLEGNNIVIVVNAKRKQGLLDLKCTSDETIFAANVMEVMGENGTDENTKVVIRFVDPDSREVLEEFEPCYAWENHEREQITFTVKINM